MKVAVRLAADHGHRRPRQKKKCAGDEQDGADAGAEAYRKLIAGILGELSSRRLAI